MQLLISQLCLPRQPYTKRFSHILAQLIVATNQKQEYLDQRSKVAFTVFVCFHSVPMKKHLNEWGPLSKAAKGRREKKKQYCKCLEQKKNLGKHTTALGKNVNWYFEICLTASKKWSTWRLIKCHVHNVKMTKTLISVV